MDQNKDHPPVCELCDGTGRIWSYGVNAMVNTVCYACKGTGVRPDLAKRRANQ